MDVSKMLQKLFYLSVCVTLFVYMSRVPPTVSWTFWGIQTGILVAHLFSILVEANRNRAAGKE